jgi:hypothetical protein
MATQVPVQTISFRGIYTMVGGVLTPEPLDWSFHIPDAEGLYFENTPNRTIFLVRNRSLTATFTLTLYPVGLPVPEYPDFLDKSAIEFVSMLPGQIEIFGPFSTNFNDANNFVHYTTHISPLPIELANIDLAVVKFPE